jgi:hypothetical protein
MISDPSGTNQLPEVLKDFKHGIQGFKDCLADNLYEVWNLTRIPPVTDAYDAR